MKSCGQWMLIKLEFMYIPVPDADVTSRIGRNAATVNDDCQYHESNTCNDLHDAEDKFNLTRLVLEIRLMGLLTSP